MRAFIAINLDDSIREAIEKSAVPLKNLRAKIKWVEKENLHLTLRFLGEVKPEIIPEVGQALKRSCRGVAPFEISLRGMGSFPESGVPRIVWVALENGLEKVRALAESLKKELSGLPVKSEQRAFKAHITIGRVKRIADVSAFRSEIKGLRELFLGSQTITSIQLMESRLSASGPHYSVIGETALA